MIGNHEEDEFVAVRVQDPRIQNEGSWNSYVDYKIFLHTNSKAFTAKTSCVRRRYSEFVWLKKKLQKNAGLVPVPNLPGKSFFSFGNEDFLEKRRKGLQAFLDKVVNTTVCLSDSQLHLFLQTQLPVGHIQDCVQGHTPYSVTDAILTYASSNRGLVQAQDDDSIKEPSLTVSYESMESPAPHQPCQQTNEPYTPELHPGCELDPVDSLLEHRDNGKAHEKSSIRISERKNHLEAIVECVCGPSATFFLGDNQDDEESFSPAEQTQQVSCQIQTPVEVHSPMGPGFNGDCGVDSVFEEERAEEDEDENAATLDTAVRTVSVEKTDEVNSSDEAYTEEINCESELCENSEALGFTDSEEQVIENDVRSQEEVLEDVISELQVLENHVTSEVNGVELVDASEGPVEDVGCLKEADGQEEPEVHQIYQEQAEQEVEKGTEDSQSLPSSNESIVKVSDEESNCDDTEDSMQAEPEEVTYWSEVEATSRQILDLQINGGSVGNQDMASPKDEDLQYMTSVDLNSTVDGGDLTESSDFSVLESSCVPVLTVDKCTEQESLLSVDTSGETLRCPKTRCIS
ncbi:hypothetical protein Q5P01_023665 [Channa striata]|uniref:PX domain-containing protein n=1 Tax=Channa striata TaxID=64152 RepID=A0AA88ITH9_CHASR|nr:hypothetical protein Q5P01_023665 [Channa striata]